MKKLLLFVGVRLVLAVILAAVVVVFKWEYFRWGVFTVPFMGTHVYWVIHVIIALLVISALVKPLRELYNSRGLPMQNSIEHLVLGFRTAFSRLSVQFGFWGVMVFVVVGALWQLGPLRDDAFRFNQGGFPWRTAVQGDSEVRLFYLFTRDNDHARYLESCLKIARDLKEVGAKAVFIPLPYFLQSDESVETIQKIHETGIAVFGVLNYWDRSFMEVVASARDLRAGLLTVDPDQSPYGLSFIQDIMFSPKGRGKLRGVAHNAVFEVLGQYYGVSSEELVWNGSEVVVGNNRYPTDANGRVFVGRMGYSAGLWSPVTAGYGMNWFGQKGIRPSDKSKGPLKFEYVDAASLVHKKPETDLRNHHNLFDGKIVVLQWNDLSVMNPSHYPWNANYAWMLDCLMQGDVPTRSDSGTAAGIILSILITAFILYTKRPLRAITLLVLFWSVQFLVPSWFFQVQGILIDAPAIFAASLAAAAVFTVIRLANEWRTRPLVLPAELAAPVTVAGTAPSSSAWVGPAFLRKRFNISYALAAGVIMLAVTFTVALTTALQKDQDGAKQEVVYVMSFPTIEVQGVYPEK